MGSHFRTGQKNMNRFVVACAFVACVTGAPSNIALSNLGYAGVGAGAVVGPAVAHAPAVVGQTHHSYAAGPAVVENRVEYGEVGQRTVQTGVASVVAGHQYAVAGHEAIPKPATSYVAGAPQNLVETRALPAPAIQGPAPADTVTQTRIAAPVRSHTRITPQVTNIVPRVQVHKYDVDAPVAVPRAVPREILVEKPVAKPYEVPVPRAVHVPAPYKVHPVQEIVETPHIHHATVETHSTQAVVTAHAPPSPRCLSRPSCCRRRCPSCRQCWIRCRCPSCCCHLRRRPSSCRSLRRCPSCCCPRIRRCCPSCHRCHCLSNSTTPPPPYQQQQSTTRLCNPK